MRKAYLIISALVVILDQFTKYLVIKNLEPYGSVPVLPFFRLVNVTNKGAAFGMLHSLGNTFFVVVSFVAIGIVTFLLLKSKENVLGLSFILGGAIGNLIDRLRLGHVTDFLDVFVGTWHWPSFNVADSFLSIGIVLMIISMIFDQRRKPVEK